MSGQQERPGPATGGDAQDACQVLLGQIYAYLDGEAALEDVGSLRQHLQDCAPCLEEYELEAALKALVRRSCQDRAPAELRARILTTITLLRTEGLDLDVTAVRVVTERRG